MENLTSIDITGDNLITARERFAYVFDLIDQRHAKAVTEHGRYTGPAFEVHVRAFPALIADHLCYAHLVHIAKHGHDAGVVALIYGDVAEVTEAASGSRTLVAALAAGEGLVHRTLDQVPPSLVRPTTAGDARHYSEALSAELWAALVVGDLTELKAVFEHLREAGEQPAGPTERRLFADALRRSADILFPGAGGMLLPYVPCVLCLAQPMMRVDELPSHQAAEHGALVRESSSER